MTSLFRQGQTVSKTGGDYTFDGTVVAVFAKLSGKVRYVVEDDRGILHIFSEQNLVPPQKAMAVSTTFDEMRNRISQLYGADRRWTLFEESMLSEIAQQPKAQAELNTILRYRESMPPIERAKFFPQSVSKLLEKWPELLDRARMSPSMSSTSPADKELDKLMRRCEKL